LNVMGVRRGRDNLAPHSVSACRETGMPAICRVLEHTPHILRGAIGENYLSPSPHLHRNMDGEHQPFGILVPVQRTLGPWSRGEQHGAHYRQKKRDARNERRTAR
jgi:hypothetical protein